MPGFRVLLPPAATCGYLRALHEKIHDRNGENIECGARIELAASDAFGRRMHQRQAAPDQPADRDVSAERTFSPATLDQSTDHSSGGLVRAVHRVPA